MNKIINVLLLLSPLFGLTQGGTYIENNGQLFIESGTTWYTEGDIIIESNATIYNNGNIELTEDWENNSSGIGIFNLSLGSVNFIGNTQFIGGNSPTEFYNLNLLGGSTVKNLKQDIIVKNNFDLLDAEFTLSKNIVHITNPSINSLLWNNGFVSGDSIGGYIMRSTNSSSTYTFPVGNISLSSSNYRGIEIRPNNADSNVFGVRLAVKDASSDNTGTSLSGALGPYDRTQKHGELFEINPNYYHHVIRSFGTSPSQLSLYFFNGDNPTASYQYKGIGQWTGSSLRWEPLNANHTGNISGPLDLGNPTNVISWNAMNFNHDIFALGVKDGTPIFIPQIFSPNGDGLNDILYARSNKIESMTFLVYNRWGIKVFESNDPNSGWDGRHNGKKAQSGVYVYYINAVLKDFGNYETKGNITLVR